MRALALSLSLLISGPVAFAQTALRPGSQNVPWGKDASTPASAATATGQSTTAQDAKPIVYQGAIQKKRSPSSKGGSPSNVGDLMNALSSNGGSSGGSSGSSGDSSNISIADARECGFKSPDPQALDSMINCANMKLSMASNAKGALVDVDQKVMFIVNRATRQVEGCVNISTGKSTGSGKGQTPLGMMITGPHDGGKYQSNADGTNADAIGLRGTDPETIARASCGVVIHKAHGRAGFAATAGCIGVDDAKFDKIKDILYGSDANPKSSAIYIHDKTSHHNCDGSQNAPTPELQKPGSSETGA